MNAASKSGFFKRVFGVKTEKRGVNSDNFWRRLLGESDGKVSVNNDSAMTFSAVYSAVDRISGDIAKLPVRLIRQSNKKVPERQSPLWTLLHDSPNPDQTAFIFKQCLMSNALRWGNGYAEIVRDGSGRPAALYPIDSSSMTVEMRGNSPVYVQRGINGERVFTPDKIFHIRTIGDGYVGKSPITLHRESIELGLHAQRAGSSLFEHGMRPGGVLEHPSRLSPEAHKRLVGQFQGENSGSSKQGKLMLVEEGMKYQALSISPTDAQYLETRTYQVREIARIYRLPPHKLADLADATFSNVEEQNREYVEDCLGPWIVQFEQEANRKLLVGQPGLYYKFSVDALLRGNAAARAAFYSTLFNLGALSQNDIRNLEDLNPIDSGDVYYVPVNLRPSDLPYATPTAPVVADAIEPDEPSDPTEEGQRNTIDDAHRRLIDEVCGRITREKSRGGGNEARYRELLRVPVLASCSQSGAPASKIEETITIMLTKNTREEMLSACITSLEVK